jgi:2-hydroxychromene-2-carboxylate isomerase
VARPPPAGSREVARVAALAGEFGRAATFVLAAGRLAFCGGFDLDDTDVLIEAAAAAELDRDAALAAAADARRDAGWRRPGAGSRAAAARSSRRSWSTACSSAASTGSRRRRPRALGFAPEPEPPQ